MKVRTAGFTIVELVFVLVLIGIVSVALLPRAFDRSGFDARGYADDLAASLRYARNLAVAGGCPVQVAVTAAGYAVTRPASFCDTGASATPVAEPGGTEALARSTPTGVAVTGVPVTWRFATDGSTDLGADATLTVGAHTLRLIAATGYVETP